MNNPSSWLKLYTPLNDYHTFYAFYNLLTNQTLIENKILLIFYFVFL